MSSERTLKATLVAVVHTQVCAIREDDDFWVLFLKKYQRKRLINEVNNEGDDIGSRQRREDASSN